MNMPRSTYYDSPAAKPDDAEIVTAMNVITDEFEAYGSHGVFRVNGFFILAWASFVKLLRYPRSEPISITWPFSHQIKLTYGRRS
jgi:hypothetical protein